MGDLNYDYKRDQSLSSNPLHQIEILYGMRQLINSLCSKTTVYLMLAGQRINLLTSGILLKMFFYYTY